MELVRQPPNSSLCGQAVVAMLAGVSLDEACDVMGHERNYPRDIKKALLCFDRTMANRSVPAEGGCGPQGVTCAAFAWPVAGEHGGHWFVWDGMKWLDPMFGERYFLPDDWKCGCYPVSQVEAPA